MSKKGRKKWVCRDCACYEQHWTGSVRGWVCANKKSDHYMHVLHADHPACEEADFASKVRAALKKMPT